MEANLRDYHTMFVCFTLLTASVSSAKPSQCCCSCSRSKVKLMLRLHTVCCSSWVSMMLSSTATTSEKSVRLVHRREGSTKEACGKAWHTFQWLFHDILLYIKYVHRREGSTNEAFRKTWHTFQWLFHDILLYTKYMHGSTGSTTLSNRRDGPEKRSKQNR